MRELVRLQAVEAEYLRLRADHEKTLTQMVQLLGSAHDVTLKAVEHDRLLKTSRLQETAHVAGYAPPAAASTPYTHTAGRGGTRV